VADRTITADLIGRDHMSPAFRSAAGAADRASAGLSSLTGTAIRTVAGIGVLGASMGAIGPVIGGLIATVVSLSGVLAALPAVAAAGGAAMIALKIGMLGFGDAMNALGDTEKFNEAIKELSPEARKTAVAVRSLVPELKQLKNAVQDRLFTGMSVEVKRLANAYLPMLEMRLGDITSAVNVAGRDMAVSLSSFSARADVATILHYTTVAAQQLRPVLTNVARSLLSVSAAGSAFLPGFATGIASASDKLAAFVEHARATGQIQQWITGGLETLRQLGDVAGNAGRIVGGIFKAAQGTGGTGLAILGDTLGRIADEVNKPAFQGGLRQVFTAIGQAASSVGDALPAVGTALAALVPAIAPLVSGAGAALGQVLTDAAGALQSMAPTIAKVGSAVAALAPHATALVVAFVALKVAAVAGNVAVAAQAAGGLRALIMALPVVRAATLAWTAAQWLLNTALLANPIGLAVLAIAALVGAVVLAWKKSETFRSVVTGVWNAVKGAASALWQGILVAWNGIVAATSRVTGWIKSAFGAVAGFIRKWWPLLVVIFTTQLAIVIGLWNRFGSKIVAGVKRYFSIVKTVVTTVLRAALAVVRTVWSGVQAGLINPVSRGVAAVSRVVGRVAGIVGRALGSAISAAKRALSPFFSVGKGIIDGVIRGVRAGVGALVGAVRGAAEAALKGAKAFLGIKSPSRVFFRIGEFVTQGFAKGVHARQDALKAAAVRMGQVIQGQVEHATSKVKDLVKARLDWMKSTKDSLAGGASIANIQAAEGKKLTGDDVIKQAQKRYKALRTFALNMARLRKLGLNRTMLQDLLGAGAEGGGQQAAAIAAGGKSAVRQLNKTQGQISKTAKGTAAAFSHHWHDQGIQAARGLVQGLQSQRAQLISVSRGMGRGIARAVKKELGIRSPSAVMRGLGQNTVMGMVRGIDDRRPLVEGRLNDLTGGPVRRAVVTTPAGGGSMVVNVYVTQPLASAAQIRTAVAQAFEQAPAGSRRIPRAAIA
jgi:phage-related protein